MLSTNMTQPDQDQFLSIYDYSGALDIEPPAPMISAPPGKTLAFDSVSRYFFFKEMAGKARSVIEPVMKKICSDLQKRGHRSVIFQEIEAAMVHDERHTAHISFIVFNETGKPAYILSRYPHIAFAASADKNTVTIQKRIPEKHGNQEINAGEYGINAITRELVEKHVTGFLAEVMAANMGFKDG